MANNQDLTIAIEAINNASAVLDAAKADFEKFAGDATKAIKTVEEKFQKAGETMKKVGKGLTVAVTLPILAAGAASIKLATDMEENINKVSVVFKDNTDAVMDWSSTTLQAFGIAKVDALDMVSLFGDMGTSMGLSTGEAEKMSTGLVGLAGDLASFKNIGIDQAQTALKGIFTGETESLKNLGIVMTQTQLEAYALSQGIQKNVQDMTESEKVNLRYAFVLEKTKNAQGDFSRTSDGAANQMRIFQANMKELGVQFGSVILPAFNKMITAVNAVLVKFQEMSPVTQKIIVAVALVAAAIGPLVLIVGTLTTAFIAAMPVFAAVGGAIMAMLGPIALVIGAVAVMAIAYKKNFLGIQDIVKTTAVKTKEFLALGWKDKLEVIKIGVKNAVLIFIAFQKDMIGNAVVIGKKVSEAFSVMWENLGKVDWGKIWEKLKAGLTKIATSVMDWAKNVWQNLKSAITGGETKKIDFNIEFENDQQSTFDSILNQDELFQHTREAVKKAGAEIDTILQKGNAARNAVTSIPSVDGSLPSASSLAPDLSGIGAGGSAAGGAVKNAADTVKKEAEKVQKELDKLQDKFTGTFEDAVKSYQDSEAEFKDTSERLKGEIKGLKDSLDDLQESFNLQNSELDSSLGKKVVEQEALISELEGQIADKLKNKEDASELTDRLQKEKEALQDFKNNTEGLEDEIAEARRRNALTEFERFVEDTEAKRESERVSYEERKEMLETELKDKEDQLEAKKKLFFEEQQVFEQIVSSFAAGNRQMVANAQTTVDQMKAKYLELKSVLDQIRAITAPKEDPDKRSDSQVFSITGAQQPISPTVFGSFGTAAAGGGSNPIREGDYGNSGSVNISIGSVDSTSRVREVETAVSRGIQRGRLRSN